MGPHPVYPSLPSFLLLLSILLLLPHTATSSFHSKPQVVERESVSGTPSSPSGNTTGGKRTCTDKVMCRPGIVLPVWLPLSPPLAEQTGRAIVYFACLMYMFLGVSIIADRFMASIEVITSQVTSDHFSLCFVLQSFSCCGDSEHFPQSSQVFQKFSRNDSGNCQPGISEKPGNFGESSFEILSSSISS